MNNEVQAFANAGAESWIAQQNFQIESIAASTDNNQKQVNQATNSIYGQGNSQASVIDDPQTSAEGYGLNWQNTPFGGSASSTNLPSVSATQNTQPVNKWATFLNAVENFSESEVSSAFGVGGAVLNAGLNAAAPSLVNGLQNEVAEHGSFALDLSAGYGVAFDAEFAFSKQGITTFFGMGVGIGVDASISTNYDFQNMQGFTSKTSVNASIGTIPIQLGGAILFSPQTGGIASSLDVQTGEGFEIESIVGYTKTTPWNDVESDLETSSSLGMRM